MLLFELNHVVTYSIILLLHFLIDDVVYYENLIAYLCYPIRHNQNLDVPVSVISSKDYYCLSRLSVILSFYLHLLRYNQLQLHHLYLNTMKHYHRHRHCLYQQQL